MNWDKWFAFTPTDALMVILSAVCIYASILLYTRITGLRSFSKMSASDFAMTLAVGSLFGASIANPKPTVGIALIAFSCLYGGQWLLASLRRKSKWVAQTLDNQPMLLMRGSEFLRKNMIKAQVTENDIIAKLREANVLDREQIRAVVFETTGDISVLHTANASQALEEKLLQGVQLED